MPNDTVTMVMLNFALRKKKKKNQLHNNATSGIACKLDW